MEYLPVLIMMGIGAVVGAGMLILPALIGPKVPHPKKNQPFECGVPIHGDTHRRFSVRFYLVAILFLLFDVEAIFFFPWAVVYRDFLGINGFIVLEMGLFVGVLVVGLYYVWRKGALLWD
jgi:NADH-quinone oxidoreductase subunit A